MARLLAKSPAEGLLPVTVGAVTLEDLPVSAITSVTPYRGQSRAVGQALKAELGLGWPGPGQLLAQGDGDGDGGALVAWAGLGEALVLGAGLAIKGAACVDQSDGWTVLGLEGAGVEEVLARLTPLDLRQSAFAPGQAARSLLGHMTCLFLRRSQTRVDLLVYRSLARTAVHELSEAMARVAARAEGVR